MHKIVTFLCGPGSIRCWLTLSSMGPTCRGWPFPKGVPFNSLACLWIEGARPAFSGRTVGVCSCYLSATASDSRGCQPPPSALKAATAARADSV
jgi:hypothetical protein